MISAPSIIRSGTASVRFVKGREWSMSMPEETEKPEFADLTKKERAEMLCAAEGHIRVATKDTPRGWHEGHCSRCGINMDYDSGD
jgi:hypothetical protein